MITARSMDELATLTGRIVVTVGVFDGIHRGHQAVFETARERAHRAGGSTLIVTLDPHPVEVIRPDVEVSLLTTPAERGRILAERFAPDAFLVYPFDRETAALTPSEFLERLLPPSAELAALIVGYDFRMGKDRSGGFEELAELGMRRGFEVVQVPPTLEDGRPISSSRIRQLIRQGRVREAAELLGHRYGVEGTVVKGRGVGRTLDFPTANVDVEDRRKLLPKFGVYAVLVWILTGRPEKVPLQGVMNLGTRPTFGGSEPAVEIHLPGFDGDLLGAGLSARFVERIRDERVFQGPEALAARIEEDVEEARKILGGC